MPDWKASMQQTFEYYVVDPGTWMDKAKINNVISCTISRDLDSDTLGSATIDVAEPLGECYIRAYLITIQNGVTEKHPLGTFLVQTPSSRSDGMVTDVSMDTYTPLLELKENPPPIGYYIPKKENVMDTAYRLASEHARAPVVPAKCSTTLFNDFVANTSDKWLTFLSDLAAYAKFRFDLDEMGRILFAPEQDTASLQPVWTYTDDDCSIIYQDINVDHDLYGIPNVVEVIYSSNSENVYVKVVNDDENSPISTVNRGREITYRDTQPSISGNPTESQIREYAEQLLRDLSTLEYTVSYSHGYCPARVGDCVRFRLDRYELKDIKGKVTSQTIRCEPGCPVQETAVLTTRLWR